MYDRICYYICTILCSVTINWMYSYTLKWSNKHHKTTTLFRHTICTRFVHVLRTFLLYQKIPFQMLYCFSITKRVQNMYMLSTKFQAALKCTKHVQTCTVMYTCTKHVQNMYKRCKTCTNHVQIMYIKSHKYATFF